MIYICVLQCFISQTILDPPNMKQYSIIPIDSVYNLGTSIPILLLNSVGYRIRI